MIQKPPAVEGVDEVLEYAARLIEKVEHVILEIASERERQMLVEGWTPDHDDDHADGEMARAAAVYALNASVQSDVAREIAADEASRGVPPSFYFVQRYWPWEPRAWKPKDRRRDLVRAAALIVAEIERLDRVNQPTD